MNRLFFAIILCLGANAHADVCSEFMPCGIYEGTAADYDVNNTKVIEFNERLEITKINDTSVNLKAYFYKGPTPGQAWTDATLTFDATGAYTIAEDPGDNFGSGFCGNNVCTVAFRPVNITEETPNFVNSFVNILRFEGNQLKRYNMIANNSDDTQLKFQRSTLTKK